MTEQQEHTWDDLVAAIGRDFSGGEVRVAADEVERGAIRKYGEPLEMDCPLFYDDQVARQHGYKGIVVPASAVSTTFSTSPIWKPGDPEAWPTNEPDHMVSPAGGRTAVPLPMPRTNASFATDIEIEYFEPVYLGDRLTSRGRKLISVNVRQTRVGYGAFMVFESEVRNQRGQLAARMRNGSYQYIAGAKGPEG